MRTLLWPSSICLMAHSLSYLWGLSAMTYTLLLIYLRCHGDVATIQDSQITDEGVRLQWHVIATAETQFA